jgi:hypothetical protein
MPGGSGLRHALTAEVGAITVDEPETPAGPPVFHGTAQNRGFSATTTVAAVTGTQAGDVLVAFASGNAATESVTPPAGAGWVLVGDTGGAVAARMYIYATTAATTDQAGGTWTWPGSHNHLVAVLAYGGVVLPTAAATARVANVTSINAPSVTSVAADAMLLTYAYFTTNGTTPAWPGSMTVRSPAAATASSGVGAEEALPVAGATGTRTFTVGAAPAAMTAAALVLESA